MIGINTAIIENMEKQKLYQFYLVGEMIVSKFEECIKNGEVKKVVNGFVDAFEDMFDCCVSAITIDVVVSESSAVEIKMKKEI